MPMSCVSGCRKMPRLCRRPMLSVSISEAPIRMGSVGRRICSRGIVLVLSLDRRLRKPRPAVSSGLITPICVTKLCSLMALSVKGERTQVCVKMSRPEKPAMKERILETADRLFYLQGIRAVGVDTIAAEIGISKRTLYNHFPVQRRADLGLSGAPLRAGAAVRQAAGRTDSRHLRFAGAALCQQGLSRLPVRQRGGRTRREDQAVRKIAIAFKESRRLWFRDLLMQLGVADAEGLATQLALLVDGSIAQDLVRERSRDGARGEGSGARAAGECGC